MTPSHDRDRIDSARQPAPRLPQQGLVASAILHLLPGVALTTFILLAAPWLEDRGVPGVVALFLGIGLVIAPLELGYLAWYTHRTTGSWSPLRAVTYRTPLPLRRVIGLAAGLTAWFMGLLLVSAAVLDGWLTDTVFGWMPATLTELATVDSGGETLSGAALAVTVVAVFILNGFVGPMTEELYFRGHLLPRLDRYGKAAPVLNTVLFSLYHFWTPWQNLARILGFLPIAWMTWRTRSIYVSLAAHVMTNTLFVLLLLSLVLRASS
jgi:uncharacterized protein